jgi:cobalt/nickel transport system ATP-binding protein
VTAPAIVARDLHFHYADGPEALAGVSLEVAAGEVVAVLGANGSGKSTLLAVLDGLALPDSGDLTVLGRRVTGSALRDPAANREFRSSVGFVFQNPDAQLFSPTVYEEIAFGLLQLGLADAQVRDRVDAILVSLGLERNADRPPFLLSGGEKKRVLIAAVLAVEPSILLLDEPTGGLDPRTQVWLLEVMEDLRRRQTTVVVATHDLGFAGEATDRSIVLSEDHVVVADGPTSDVLADVPTLLAANLIHEHAHAHGSAYHAHPHAHGLGHRHETGDDVLGGEGQARHGAEAR